MMDLVTYIVEWLMTFPLWFQMTCMGVVLLVVLMFTFRILSKDITIGRFKVLSSERRAARKTRKSK